MKFTSSFTVITSLFVGAQLYSQQQGMSYTPEQLTVKQVLQKASALDRKDSMVALDGYFVKRINDEDYWFVDKDDDKIRVSIEDDKRIDISLDQKVTIIGEVDDDFIDGIEFEASRIIVSR